MDSKRTASEQAQMKKIFSRHALVAVGVRGRIVMLPRFAVKHTDPDVWYEILIAASEAAANEAAERLANYIEDCLLGDSSVAVQRG